MSWLIHTEWAPLLAENPDVSEIIPFPRQKFRGVAGAMRFARWCGETIAGSKPALALDFQGLLRSALIGKASQAETFYGLADAREGARWFYDGVAPMPPAVTHAVDRYLMLASTALRWAGGNESARSPLRFPLPAGTEPGAWVEGVPDDFILLHPFARGAGKSLTASQIEAFCRRLTPRQVVVVGRRTEAGFEVPRSAVDLLDRTTLPELIWVIRKAAVVVSVDSGPSHLAAALGKPLVAIHTWSDPRRVGPYRGDAWVWKNGRLLPMHAIADQGERFFRQAPSLLSLADIEAICALAISL